MFNLRDIVLAQALGGGSSGGGGGDTPSGGGDWIGDGKTHLWIKIAAEGRMDVPLYFSQTVANGVTIDWGDGSALQTLSGTGNVKTTHTYARIGEYCITLDVADGCTLGLGHNSETAYCVMGPTITSGRVYTNMLQKAEIGNGVTNIGSSAFNNCHSLASIIIPDGVTSIEKKAFYYCYSLASISIPDSVTSMGVEMFCNCYSLTSIIIPDSITSIGQKAFYNCYSLASIIIPDGVTSIEQNAFYNCHSLASFIIPNGVTSIGAQAFYDCSGFWKIRFEGATPPTVSNSNAFLVLPTDCIISVPVGSLEAYKTATNYPDPNTYTYVEE